MRFSDRLFQVAQWIPDTVKYERAIKLRDELALLEDDAACCAIGAIAKGIGTPNEIAQAVEVLDKLVAGK